MLPSFYFRTMARRKIKKAYKGTIIRLFRRDVILDEYLLDSEYNYIVKEFPQFFMKPKKVKKIDINTES